MDEHRPIVAELVALLKARPELEAALRESIRKAGLPDIAGLPQYLDFLNEMVVLIPADRNLNSIVSKFHFLIGLSPGGVLRSDPSFQDWSLKFAEDWGSFLDTTDSAKEITGFFSNPRYHIADYAAAPSGWLTFNQFFARQVRPGKRPVDGRCDDGVVVSPADSVFQGQWSIQNDSKITVKGLRWSVLALLDGSPYQDKFRGGVFTHSFLDVNDYHRFHVPVGGTVKEVRKIPGKVMMDVIKKPDGTLDAVDGTGYQFTQDRGLIVIDSPLGFVAVLPIGMAQVSSVNLTAEAGSELAKGEEFGFFAFGGSDIVTLFEAGKVQLEAKIGTHYNQGRRIGRAAGHSALAPADTRQRTLLYVEDNPANLTLVEQLIARRSDIRLLTAVNGTLGIERARESRPEAILMDINLPGISGIEALKILREDPATARIPVVALSANAMASDVKKGLEAGFFSYLTKPIKVAELMDTIDAALESAGRASGRTE